MRVGLQSQTNTLNDLAKSPPECPEPTKSVPCIKNQSESITIVSTAPLPLELLSPLPPLVLLMETAALVDALDPLPPPAVDGPSSRFILFLFDPAVLGREVGVGSSSESDTSITSVREAAVDWV